MCKPLVLVYYTFSMVTKSPEVDILKEDRALGIQSHKSPFSIYILDLQVVLGPTENIYMILEY